jgi:hypothetical protein
MQIIRLDKPLSYVDQVAQTHDLRYVLAQTEVDVRTAVKKIVQRIAQGRRIGKDRNLNLHQSGLIKAKILLEEKLCVLKSWFASYGRERIKNPCKRDAFISSARGMPLSKNRQTLISY